MLQFGFDLGTTSIGFAAVDYDPQNKSGRILRLGVRIFPEARDADATPLNQTRRAKRMMRRQLRRRKDRRRALNQLLSSAGLLPAFGGKDWDAAMQVEPYGLRAKALSAPLSPLELGRVLYHLAKRRHFKERDIAEAGESADEAPDDDATSPKRKKGAKAAAPAKNESADEAKAKEARAHFVADVIASGQTIGAVLAARPEGAKKRGEHATRALVEAEFEKILAVQTPHHPVLAKPEIQGALREAIFKQRPVFWRKSTLGKCALMPDAPLCPKGSWLSQERRMLEKVNNLEFAGGNARPLDEEERAALIAALHTQKSLSWGGARKILEPLFQARGESVKRVKFNHETQGEDAGGLKGNLVEVELSKAFGDAWASHPRKDELREFLPDALWQADYREIGEQRVVIRAEKERVLQREHVQRKLVEDFGATPKIAAGLVKVHFPQGWEPYSTEALRRILPELEKGARFGALLNSPLYAEWRDAIFPNRDQPTGETLDRLPSPRADKEAKPAQREEAERIGKLRNPTVVRVQNELRKVVNNLIGLYGKPDRIRIELARDIGKSKREREEMEKAIRDNERKRDKARKDLIDNKISAPSDADIEKWLLWQECGRFCPYTGAPIDFADLFSGNPRFDIEHIWPRSKSLDNSMRNKTLCRKDVNLKKGARIPYEYFAAEKPDEWPAVKDRVWKMVGKEGMAPGKAKRFCAESMPEEFASRQLNDTGYAAREAMASLKRLWPDVGATADVKVRAVTGKVTAQLRRRWGLNYILGEDGEKTRADHRHHAIDALVVALTEDGDTIKLSRYFAQEADYKRGLAAKPDAALVPPPWMNFRADVERAVGEIIVSHRVRKKVSGPLHKETTYGDTREDITNSNGTYRFFVARKPLQSLTKGEIENIRDGGLRDIVAERAEAFGGDLKKAFAGKLERGPNGPDVYKVRLAAPQKLRAMAKLKTGYATMGNNHHIVFYRLPDGKVEGEVVSLYEATRRLARREPVVCRGDANGRAFAMSLSLGDTFFVPEGERSGYWTVKSISGNGQVFCKPINDADPGSKGLWGPSPAPLLKLGARKVSVDPIGRVRPAND